MSRNRLIVISADAMEDVDEAYAATLPYFGRLLKSPARAQIESVYPTLTYPNHTAQITGCRPATSGIFNNVLMQPGIDHPDWFWYYDMIRVSSILDAAAADGRSIAAVDWPATAGAPFEVVIPEIGNEDRTGGEDATMASVCSPRGYQLWLRHRDLIGPRPKRNHGAFAAAVAADVLREDRPDVLMLHLVELDSARHKFGPRGAHVAEALRTIDSRLQVVLEALEDAGTTDQTNIVIVSDHGQLDVVQHTNLNVLLAQRGLLEVDENHRLVRWDAYLHSSGLSGQLFCAEDISAQKRRQLEDLLDEIVADPAYRIRKVWTAAEARESFGLDGPFDYVVESDPGVIVGGALDRRVIVRRGDPDFGGTLGNHGHHPGAGDQPVFFATGPDFVSGADAGRHSMIDEAATFAAVLGVDLPSCEGTAMSELLATGESAGRVTGSPKVSAVDLAPLAS
ncbi:MAG: ectonucleotide pyrophosphatase/phosphodiesterase [Acidipropionibacterium acidipropionici]|jgi:predicted AlkP superfamily pyrophosphatase or phosphodiesterase|uniref:alkaline phosphatase family protein n=1 Tax=Acidipropionibacterium acidipropionici TaxID=1748 RepID=UPI002F3597F0